VKALKNKQLTKHPENTEKKHYILNRVETFAELIHRINPIYWLASVIVSIILFVIFIPHSKWNVFWSVLQSKSIILLMLFVFCLIGISLVWSTGQRVDAAVFLFFNKIIHHSPKLDGFMLGFSQLGNSIFTMVIALLMFLSVHHLLAYELILGTLTLWLVVEFIKVLIHRSRPFKRLDSTHIVGSSERGCSFPSGHTSQIFFTTTLIIHYFNFSGFSVIFLYIICLLVGITRIYVGAHYPRDVFAGAILGSIWGLMGIIVNNIILR
jgi:membrane-associated phospholipid phosphatase